jgi:thioredoxin reductase
MNSNTDYLIIGAGPAGLQLGYFLEQNNRDYLILDKANKPGAFFASMPRHRKLISINKVHIGTDDPVARLRWDWNSLLSDREDLQFRHYTEKYFPDADVLCRYLEDFAAAFDLNIQHGVKVVNVDKVDGRFVVTDAQGNTYTAKRLIVATGIAQPYIPNIPGVELCENYVNHSIDPQVYVNKRVLVVGKGNSAFEAADNLVETAAAIHILSPESVKFAWQTHYVGNLRAVYNNFLDTYQLKSQNTVIDATIDKIEKENGKYQVHLTYTHAHGQTAVVEYDHVIFCTGFRFDPTFFGEGIQPALVFDGRLPAQTSEWESANIPDLYFAGVLMSACDHKKTMSAFIHGFRHNIEALSNVLAVKYHDEKWPHETIEATPQAVTDKVIDRVNRAPEMFLQPGFLCDVMVVNEMEGTVDYFNGVRKDYVMDSHFSQNNHYYTISLEYGHFLGDPFSVERNPDPNAAVDAAYLHPVIRHYRFDELVSEHHINDDLESHWYKDEYVMPALAYFEAELALEPAMALAMD